MWVYGVEDENSETSSTPLMDKNDKNTAKKTARDEAEDNVKSKYLPSLAVLEICSGVLSLLAIVVAIGYAFHGNFEKLRISTWRQNTRVLTVNVTENGNIVEQEAARNALASYSTAWDTMADVMESGSSSCPSTLLEKNKLASVSRNYNGTTYVSAFGMTPDYELNPWVILIYIFCISALFQFLRGCKGKGDFFWMNKLFAHDEFSVVGASRWVEYALTSPLQIIIIAWTLDVASTLNIVFIGCAQLCLVALGLPIEIYMQKYNKCLIKLKSFEDDPAQDAQDAHYAQAARTTDKKNTHRNTAIFYFTFAALAHGLLWGFLARTKNEITESFKCLKESLPAYEKTRLQEAEQIISVVFWLEFALFTCFALVIFFNFMQLFFGHKHDDDSKNMYARMYTRAYYSNYLYAIFSILSKTALEFGFIFLFERVSGMR